MIGFGLVSLGVVFTVTVQCEAVMFGFHGKCPITAQTQGLDTCPSQSLMLRPCDCPLSLLHTRSFPALICYPPTPRRQLSSDAVTDVPFPWCVGNSRVSFLTQGEEQYFHGYE